MTEESPPGIGTVAQEAARLIEDMATMARSGYNRSAAGPAGPTGPAEDSEPDEYEATHDPAEGTRATDDRSEEPCSLCGGERDDIPRDDTPSTCKVCPLCRGIALLRSVRPETVDMLADLALSVAASLRDVATRSRAADPTSSGRTGSGGSADPDRDSVQDIPVDDDSEG